METSVWAGVAMLYGLAPLAVFCGILYYAHYHAKEKGMRIFLYLTGGGGRWPASAGSFMQRSPCLDI